jgi:glutaredoxin-related protein
MLTVLKKQGIKFVSLDLSLRKDLHTALNLQPRNVYVKGDLIGDVSKIKELGEEAFVKLLPAGSVVETLEQRLKKIINQQKVMLFMKGSP